MTAGAILEKGADRLQELADRAAAHGGPTAKLAEPLAEDAILLRRMKPNLIKARMKGEAPTDLESGSGAAVPTAQLQLDTRPKRRGGPNPLLVIGIAFAAGLVLARVLDWKNCVDED